MMPDLAEADRNRRGLLNLMMRMPSVRGRLRLLCQENDGLLGLCGAYDDATSTLERLRKARRPADRSAIAEYEGLCREIEEEIIENCCR